MKRSWCLLVMIFVLVMGGCGSADVKTDEQQEIAEDREETSFSDAVKIELSNEQILVDGKKISQDKGAAVYKANDIIFYLENQGIEYGEGTKKDEHSQIEGDAHTVIHITEPGVYEVSGTLEAGQIFVDLGDGTKNDEDAVATVILNNADIACTVAPAILFYRTYECSEVDEEDASMEVDTSMAGANLVLADGSYNRVYGSYVAEIYESCELNEAGTEVIDSKKLYKFDGAVYSRRSINVSGNGALEIVAENEGFCSEMHMTVNGGKIDIKSGNDGINTSEDGVSVFAINAGELNIQVTGETGEGDGIDSNGWLVINGGNICAAACSFSMDAGVDADKGIYINGGTLVATGNMPAEIADGTQSAVSFIGREKRQAEKEYEIRDAEEQLMMEISPTNEFSALVVSAESLTKDEKYTIWLEGALVAESGMKPPEGMWPPKEPKR